MNLATLPTLTVLGTGFFAPAYETLADAMAERARAAVAPKFPLVEGRNRRFTSLVTQMHMDACGQALSASGVSPKSVRSIFASAGGELETAVAILDGITQSAQVSAARFVQSVHNTPSGVFSIATGNTEPSNTITAGEDTVAVALFEAALLLSESSASVIVSFGDEAIPSVFRTLNTYSSFAAAIVLGCEKRAGCATLRLQTFAEGDVLRSPGGAVPAPFASSPIGSMTALLHAVTRSEKSTIAVGSISLATSIACEVAP